MYMTETISKLMEVKFTQSVIDPRIAFSLINDLSCNLRTPVRLTKGARRRI
jgi:hypothetical protein